MKFSSALQLALAVFCLASCGLGSQSSNSSSSAQNAYCSRRFNDSDASCLSELLAGDSRLRQTVASQERRLQEAESSLSEASRLIDRLHERLNRVGNVDTEDERMVTFIMQENSFDYGATGHSGGVRHWETVLFRLESIAEYINRRLILLPPALMLDPKHLTGNVFHGWDLIYNRSFDDPRFRTWEDVMQRRGDVSKSFYDVRQPDLLSTLKASTANLVVLQQHSIPGSAFWDAAPLADVHRSMNGRGKPFWQGPHTGASGPPPPSRYIKEIGTKIVQAISPFITIHVRRGDAVGAQQGIFVAGQAESTFHSTSQKMRRGLGGLYTKQYSRSQIDGFTSVDRIREVLVEIFSEADGQFGADTPVVIFTNERNATYFDSLKTNFHIIHERDLMRTAMHEKGDYQHAKVMARSYFSSSVFAMALDGFLAQHGTITVCTVAAKMYKPCDYLLSYDE